MKWDCSMKDIYIYGAGEYGRFMYSYLDAIGKKDDIRGFLVTSLAENGDTLFDKKIYEFQDYLDNMRRESDTVIVALGVVLIDEVVSYIVEKGIHDYITLDGELRRQLSGDIRAHYAGYPIQKNKVFCESFSGKTCSCNPRYIAKGLLERCDDVDIVCCVRDVCKKKNYEETLKYRMESEFAGAGKGKSRIRFVQKSSPEFFYEYCTSAVYVSNLHNDNLYCKRDETYYMETWHGIGPAKKCGLDTHIKNPDLYCWRTSLPNVMLSGSEFNDGFYRTAFRYSNEIMKVGYPRNDIFFRENSDIKKKVYDIYGIPYDKRIVLYAPTFRQNFAKDSYSHYTMDFRRMKRALEKRFGGEFVCFERIHHTLRQYLDERAKIEDGITDVSDYQDTQELLVAADVLISDYSSTMWDFGLQRKPVFLYHADVDEYVNDRDFYSSPSEWPYIIGHSNDELEEKILSFDEESYRADMDAYYKKYGSYDDGHATEKAVDRIIDVMEGKTGNV